MLCANLYFPFRSSAGRDLLASFLQKAISPTIQSVARVELEYEAEELHLKPKRVLGEDGGRGAGQTSPDVAFLVETLQGPGVVLVESKFTEHWFYQCSGYRKKTVGRPANPNRERCNSFATILDDTSSNCHLGTWGRKYWQHVKPSSEAARLFGRCPAASGGYQLLRQQALAEALAADQRFRYVVSAVAYDARNEYLFRVADVDGEKRDIRQLWVKHFASKAEFAWFTHQEWVSHVRAHDAGGWQLWLDYVANRYGF